MDILKSVDIALAMILVYLIFSLGVTAFNEFLAATLSSRARWLKRGIESLLSTSTGTNAGGADEGAMDKQIKAFYASPYISFLGGPTTDGKFKSVFAPSYIPAWTLVQGLLDSASQTRSQALSTFEDIKTAVDGLPDRSPIKVALTDLLARADGRIDALKPLVDEWFKSFETQVSAWYRQKTQVVLVGLSLLVAGFANLDTVAMVRALSTDTQLRETLVAKALEVSDKDNINAILDTTGLTAAKQALAEAKTAGKTEADITKLQVKVDDERRKVFTASSTLMEDVTSTGLPLGWRGVDVWNMPSEEMFHKIIGLLLSGFALSLGAPFWFDMLQKVAAMRSVGKSLVERGRTLQP
jgi:hypothetical protein